MEVLEEEELKAMKREQESMHRRKRDELK